MRFVAYDSVAVIYFFHFIIRVFIYGCVGMCVCVRVSASVCLNIKNDASSGCNYELTYINMREISSGHAIYLLPLLCTAVSCAFFEYEIKLESY